jgi:fatty acid desaturase
LENNKNKHEQKLKQDALPNEQKQNVTKAEMLLALFPVLLFLLLLLVLMLLPPSLIFQTLTLVVLFLMKK